MRMRTTEVYRSVLNTVAMESGETLARFLHKVEVSFMAKCSCCGKKFLLERSNQVRCKKCIKAGKPAGAHEELFSKIKNAFNDLRKVLKLKPA